MESKSRERNWNAIQKVIADQEDKEGKELTLEKQNITKVKHLLSNYELSSTLEKVAKPDSNFNYSNLIDLSDKIRQLDEQLQLAKEEIDLDEFYKRGEILDFKKLRVMFKEKGLGKRFPNFKFDRFEEIFKNPPTELTNYKGETIPYDRFLIKKILIGINQMIFSEMDLYMINVGKEGAGKSCFSSQVLLYIYHILNELGLIKYKYEIKKLFFSSLRTLLEMQNAQADDDYFRLSVLDEAYELNRMNFREDGSKEYKDDMRSSRKMLRIVILNLPQIGELETAITLTRSNFLFYADMDSVPKLGIVKKGECDMYIIPRGKKIYSPYQRRNISDEEITNSLNKVMRDKNDAYKGFPKNCLINKLKFVNVWGFDKEEYDKYIKKENKKRRGSKDIKMTDYVGYILYKKLPAIKNWGAFDLKDKADKRMYYTIQKWIRQSITNRYILNPELVSKFELLYESEAK